MKKSATDKQSKQFTESVPDNSLVARLKKDAQEAEANGDLTQAEKFAQAARDLGADQDEEVFKGVVRKLAKVRTSES